ncbi:MAG: cytochrome c, partial [Chloroflexi bacterium]
MRKALRWLGIALAGLAGLLVIAAASVYFLSQSRINKTYTVPEESLPITADAETLARGEHVAIIRGCTDCHGPDLAGKPFLEDPALGMLYARNLTAGQGGAGRDFTDADWVRAIRHGIGPDGKPLLFMPAQEFYYLSDEDLAAVIAYVKSVPSVDNELPESRVGPLGRILFLAGKIPLIPAELVDHDAPRPASPPPGITVEYGRYLSLG